MIGDVTVAKRGCGASRDSAASSRVWPKSC